MHSTNSKTPRSFLFKFLVLSKKKTSVSECLYFCLTNDLKTIISVDYFSVDEENVALPAQFKALSSCLMRPMLDLYGSPVSLRRIGPNHRGITSLKPQHRGHSSKAQRIECVCSQYSAAPGMCLPVLHNQGLRRPDVHSFSVCLFICVYLV